MGEADSLTINEAVDKIATRINIKLILVFIVAISTVYTIAADIYITIFTGFIPYTEWACSSERCLALLGQANSTVDEFYSHKTMCHNDLVAGEDFNWTSSRTSFSMEWGFYCGTESKLAVASSFLFIGAFLGLLTSTAIFDRVGRKNGAIVGIMIAAVATLAGTWVPNYEGLLVIRIFQGYGHFIQLTGVYCWVVEFSPSSWRETISGLILDGWAMGYIMIVAIGYFVPNWRFIFLAKGIINFVAVIPLFIFPVSPRFSLIRGRNKEAKKTLESYSKVCGNETSFKDINLIYEERVQNYWQQLKDFTKFPTMLKETVLSIISWFIVAVLFYGFSFGWSKLTPVLYTSYLLAAFSKVIAFSSTIPACKWLGRKRALQLFLLIGILSNFLAMPDVQISESWTLEFIACLIGSIAVSAAFAILYLFTSELAPTSHRGMILSLSSSSARIGSFIGPYVSLLYDVTDRRVPLALFAGATLVMCVAVQLQADTSGKQIPETPKGVELRAGSKKYRPVEPENYDLE